ncbi:hypothetical protein [Photobacterium leiognathi]|uniref:hypothetical protein n=1 Tax=Photobacterium leiognathi TaxID=553611 RepID=UPI002981601D|nr:hypothetical protein [Photobacterium leiognathi]
MTSRTFTLFAAVFSVPFASASVASSEVQDMSDPLAVYTQGGVGMSNNGLNLKMGKSYDTKDPTTMAMNIFEIKGFMGEHITHDGDDSIDSIRFRNFQLDLTNGRGSQIDVNWNFDNNLGSASYSMIQALPKWGALQLYPLAGLGITVTDTANIDFVDDSLGSIGYAIPSSYVVVGTYAKVDVTDKIWLNYNPMYISTLNNNEYMSDLLDGFHHEAAVSYKLNDRQTIRTFANWDHDTQFKNGDFRLEFNHQF